MRDVTELVVKAQTGDRNSLASLIAAVQDDIWRFQRSRARNEADAEDATQETFARMIAALPGLRDPRTFAGWLYRIALNEANAAGRRRGAEERAADALAAEASTSTNSTEADAMERAELQATVRRAVGGLEPRLRTAVELRYEHGLSYADMARAMDCPEGTVADRLHTAHERLRRVLAGAGVAIALAVLERELAAAPAEGSAPARLGSRLARMALEGPTGGGGAEGPRRRTVAAMIGAAAILAGLIAWMLWSPGNHNGEESTGPAAEVASATPSGGKAVTSAETSERRPHDSTRPAQAVPGKVRGRVLEANSGDPIAHARVSAFRRDDPQPRQARVTAETDARGEWELELEAGGWELQARAGGFVPLQTSALVWAWREREEAGTETVAPGFSWRFDLEVLPGSDVARDIRLERGAEVAIRVTDPRGMPLEGVRVRCGQQQLRVGPWPEAGFTQEGYLPELASDAGGRLVLSGVFPEGQLSLVLSRSDLVRREVRVAATGGETVVVMQPGVAITGVVLDTFGVPLPHAQFFGLGDASGAVASLDQVAAPVDELGRFDIAEGAAGSRLLLVWAPGHGVALVPLEGSAHGRADFRLAEATGVVTGSVRDADGRPIAGARVQLAWVGARWEDTTVTVSYQTPMGSWHWPDGASGGCLPGEIAAPEAITAADGTFRLEKVPTGVAGIRVTAPGCQSEVADVAAGTTKDIMLQPLEADEEE